MQSKSITTLSALRIAIMSVSAGLCVSSMYYAQPILNDIAADFKTTENAVGMLPVFTQIGYGMGLFFITPYGDKMNSKRLILLLNILQILALLGMAFVNSFMLLYVISLLIGITASAAQVIMPMAAGLEKQRKGKVVGIVFTGLLSGILLARVFSGYIAELMRWHYVYILSAGMLAVVAFLFYKILPDVSPRFSGSYFSLLQSTLFQLKRFAVLRRIALIGALLFGLFSSFWTTITFHLNDAPFYYGSDKIGLLGLVAVGGALLAPFVGQHAERGRPARMLVSSIIVVMAAIVLLVLFPKSIMAIVGAVFVLDVGVQVAQTLNISTLYTLDEQAHSRINTAYMTIYFIGGAIGTFAGVRCWNYGGWNRVILQLLAFALLAGVLAVFHKRRG